LTIPYRETRKNPLNQLKDCPQNFTVASLLGQLAIFRTIFQPWALPNYISAAERDLFTISPVQLSQDFEACNGGPSNRKIPVKIIFAVKPNRLAQCCTQFKSPRVEILCVLYSIVMKNSHLNDMKSPETRHFIPKGFELGTTLN